LSISNGSQLTIVSFRRFTTNMIQSFYEDKKHNTYTLLVAFYLAARLFNAAHCAMTAVLLPLVKGSMISNCIAIIIPSVFWIASIHVEMPSRLGLIFTALALDLFGPTFIVGAYRYSRSAKTEFSSKLGKWFEFYPAINIEHKVERTNAFVSLVFGYSAVAVMFQNYGTSINAFLGKAILGLCQAFIFNWLYFDVDGSNLHLHAIRRQVYTGEWNLRIPQDDVPRKVGLTNLNSIHLAICPSPIHNGLYFVDCRPF
jgi:low temperature requirement protein LtrA